MIVKHVGLSVGMQGPLTVRPLHLFRFAFCFVLLALPAGRGVMHTRHAHTDTRADALTEAVTALVLWCFV